MTTFVRRNGGLLPSVFSDLMDTDRFFDTDLFDLGMKVPSRWVPGVNIAESPKEFRITLSAAGMKKDDFKINVENDVWRHV